MKIVLIGTLICLPTFFQLFAEAGTAEHISPEAEVIGRKKPIQLTLRLYRKQVRANEHLWYQIELKNIGKQKINIWDNLFADPDEMNENASHHRKVYIEVIGPDGDVMQVDYRGIRKEFPDDDKQVVRELTPEEAKETGPLIEAWKKEGLSVQEINLKLMKYADQEASEDMFRKAQTEPFWLSPGVSTTTKPWAYRSSWAKAHHYTSSHHAGQFAELVCYWLLEPGKYQVRAVYNHYIDPKAYREYHMSPSPEDILLKTPPIEITVLPMAKEDLLKRAAGEQELIDDARRHGDKELETIYTKNLEETRRELKAEK